MRRSTVLGVGALVLAGAIAASVVGFGGGPPPVRGRSTTPVTSAPPPVPVPSKATWRVAWGSPMAFGFGPAADTTVRDLTTIGIAGSAIRIRISNLFGDAPLVVGAATVAQAARGAATVPGSMMPVHFAGAPAATVPVGQMLTSDPVPLAVTAGETLAVSLYVADTDMVSFHPYYAIGAAAIHCYFAPNGAGNLTSTTNGRRLPLADGNERWVDNVDVLQSGGGGSIVVLGDSISDGYHSSTSWVTVLQQRIDMLPADQQRAAVDEAITANALTAVVPTDSAKGGGPSGLDRFARDVTSQPGVSEVILALGTNDLWFGASAAQLIEGYRQAIAAARAAGLRIVAVTLLPRQSNPKEPWGPAQQAQLEQVDAWIRTSGAFDGVLDLAPVVADVYNGVCAPDMLFPGYDSGDHLHPNAAGDTAMADAVNLQTLGIGSAPEVPPLVAVSPTAGCDASAAPAPAG